MELSIDLAVNRFNLPVLILLSFGHLVTDLFQGALPAVLPFLKMKLGLSYTATGTILLVATLTSSVIQPAFGAAADRKEKPLFMPMGVLSAAIGFSLMPFAPSFAVLLPLVMISGLGIAAFHPEGFRTTHFFTGEKKATGMSIFSVGGNLGFAIGPVLALSVIQELRFDALPLVSVPAAVFLVLLLFFWRAVIVRREESGPSASARGSGLQQGRWLILALLIGVVIMRSWVQVGLLTYIPFYVIDYLKGDSLHAGTLVSTFLLGGAVGTLAGSPLADRWGHKRYLVVSMLLSSVVMPLTLITEGPFLYLALGTLGFILISTFSVTVVMAQHLMPDRLGMASGLMAGFAIGTGGICVTLLGVVADRFGVPAALQSIAILPVIGFLIALFLPYKEDLGSRL